ncbi:phage virion morphogenesis protein [uncultured Mucilaginibacter sp.]|uniref:phage virion morphogenesis protein n=1 Tax=uncultured Mucilaginibacter sp. TaxID=797541 RepID=UPI0025CF4B11|nr:phage virion morphogenesis protein [uncultured Mucilaginibacter sp.]
MGLPETAQFIRLVDNISRAIDRLPNRVATEAVNFSKQRFVDQNWLDSSPKPWKKRSDKSWKRDTRKGRAILVDKAVLKRSVRKIISTPTLIIIGTDVPYAQIHNDGGRFTAHQTVGSYRRRAYQVKEHSRTRAGRTEEVRAHNVSASTVRSFNRTIHVDMPQRRFLGPSAALNRKIETLMRDDIVKAAQQSI